MSWTLFVGDRYVCKVNHDLPHAIFSVSYNCIYCGQTYARRLLSPHKMWLFASGVCISCAKQHRVLEPQSFLLDIERAAGILPPAVLAAEFLFNYDLFLEYKDGSSTERHPEGHSWSEDSPDGR